MTRWSHPRAYRPDLYASLAAVTLPDSGKPSRGTASKATDLFTFVLARSTAMRGNAPRALRALGSTGGLDSRRQVAPAVHGEGAREVRGGLTVAARKSRALDLSGIAIAFAINALLWATIVVCFLLLASGSL